MTTSESRAWARKHAVPLAFGLAVVVVAAVFHSTLLRWFTGDAPAGDASTALTATVGDTTVGVALSPEVPRESGNALIITLVDKDAVGIAGADVSVSVWMPAMGSMQEMRTSPKVTERRKGEYRAAFDLAMGGTWNVDIAIAWPAGTIDARYTLTVGTAGLVPVDVSGKGAAPAAPRYAFTPASRSEIARALAAYEQLRAALASDSLDGVATHASTAATALRAIGKDATLPESLRDHVRAGAEAADTLAAAKDVAAARAAFGDLSEHIISAAGSDPAATEGWYAFECPMTEGYNKWLQPSQELRNPYMGQDMLTCGSNIDLAEAAPGAVMAGHVHDPNDIAHYTCPMDTWVKQPDPGRCPVCGMDLLPVTKEELRTGVMRIDHRRRQLIGLRTGVVERRDISVEIKAVGMVAYDESRIADVTLKYDGWIERLLVDTTGERVRKGQPLLTLYSPELYTAQQDYLLALAQTGTARDEASKARSEAIVRGARRRLELLDVPAGEIDRITKSGEPSRTITIRAPAAGVVVDKNVVDGGAFKRGDRLYRIASIDRVWVEADIYEQDLPLVEVGQKAVVTLTHLPGKAFEGKVAFIYPYLDKGARTARARVELPNRDFALKPDMYANVTLQAGRGERLVVPESAVIYSGPRRIVFLDLPNDQLAPKAIEVGVKSGGYFEVLSGLEAGDRVVTSGNFLLSAESRLKSATGLW